MSNDFTLGALPPGGQRQSITGTSRTQYLAVYRFLCYLFERKQQQKNRALEEDEKDDDESSNIDDQEPPNSIGIHEEALYLEPAG